MPTRVPAVPGPKGTRPLPKPVAINLINFSNRKTPLISIYTELSIPSFQKPVNGLEGNAASFALTHRRVFSYTPHLK
jgi:hypothetical protein